MRALVVYESMFGNTRDVASAVADGLRTVGDVETVEVGVAPSRPPADVDHGDRADAHDRGASQAGPPSGARLLRTHPRTGESPDVGG